jgi:hypothetical protein
MRNTTLILMAATALIACGRDTGDAAAQQAAAAGQICEVVQTGMTLPTEVRETSGLARSFRNPDLFWTHNDAGNQPVLFAIGADGRITQRVQVTGAELVDWEDIESAPCAEGACLFIGDIGDNDGARQRITMYRIAEPADGATTARAVALHARFPDGPRDAESLFADRAGNLFIVTKGREEDIALYRYPAPQRAGETVTLERVRTLFPQPRNNDDRITSATATPDGRWVAIRSYRSLYLYALAALTSGNAAEPSVVDLAMLGETQGEAIVLADDGIMWTSSEADGDKALPRWSRSKCRLGGG